MPSIITLRLMTNMKNTKYKSFALLGILLLAMSLTLAQEAVGSYEGRLQVGVQNGVISISDPNSGNLCGNRIINSQEQCDGINLAGNTCASILPGTVGTLSCSRTCTWNTSLCTSSGILQGSGGGGGSTRDKNTTTSGSSGGSAPSTCVENWECSEWSICDSEGMQTRTCTDSKACGTTTIKPEISKKCEGEENKPFFSMITGAVVGALAGAGAWKTWIIIFLILVGLYLIVTQRKKAAIAAAAAAAAATPKKRRVYKARL